jgi:hypothetical protein
MIRPDDESGLSVFDMPMPLKNAATSPPSHTLTIPAYKMHPFKKRNPTKLNDFDA